MSIFADMIDDLTIKRTEIDFTNDSIVVRKFTNGIFGGVTLDVSSYPYNTVSAGQVVITDGQSYRPMPIMGESYGTMPHGYRFFGVIYRSSKATQGVSVMTRGTVNKYAAPYDIRNFMAEHGKENKFIILASDQDEMEGYARLECTDGVVYTKDGYEIWFRD